MMVHFKLGDKVIKIKWSRAWDKEKIWQESNPWPPVHRAGALSTEPRKLMESEAIKLISCMKRVLHTATNSNVEVVVVKDVVILMSVRYYAL